MPKLSAMTRLLCLAAIAGAVAGGQDDWRAAHTPEDGGWRQAEQHFVFHSGPEPETLDPAQVTSMDAFRLVECLFEGLTSPDPETLQPRPAAASRWTVSEDRLTYTFHLRPALRWSDGKALTSTHFLDGFRRALTPATAASYVSLYYYIAGAKDFHRGKADEFGSVGLQAPDDATLQIRLAHPCPFLPELLTMPIFFPVRQDVVSAHGDTWTKPENLVCNGPFVLASWRPRDRLTFKPNPAYWDREFVKIESVTALILGELNTAYKLYLDGKMHWLPSVPLPRMAEVKRHPDFYAAPFLGTYFYRFNVTRPPFDNALVRRAFGMATNRREITDQLLKGGQQPRASFCPEVAGYRPVDGLAYDVPEAREALRRAGYGEDGKPFPSVELTYNTNEGHKQIAEAIAQQWKRNLGVNVTTRNLEWKVFLADMRTLDYQMCRASWIGDYGDPSTFFDIFESTSGNNRTGWGNARYDALLEQTRRERDLARRLELFQQMERILVEEDCPILPVYGYVNTGLLSEAVGGWYPNVRNQHPLKYIWLE